MSIQKHYIIIGNRRHGYTLYPAQKVTTLVCKSANISGRFPNDQIPNILTELPRIILEQYETFESEPQTEVLRFRVSESEKEQIELNASEAGYGYVSAYLRDVSLQRKRDENN